MGRNARGQLALKESNTGKNNNNNVRRGRMARIGK